MISPIELILSGWSDSYTKLFTVVSWKALVSYPAGLLKSKQLLFDNVVFLKVGSFVCFLYQISMKNMPKTGSICQVLVQVPHVFQMFSSDNFMDHDAR